MKRQPPIFFPGGGPEWVPMTTSEKPPTAEHMSRVYGEIISSFGLPSEAFCAVCTRRLAVSYGRRAGKSALAQLNGLCDKHDTEEYRKFLAGGK